MEKACTDLVTAEKYSFSAKNYLPDDSTGAGQYPYSKQFDYDSLRIYGSYAFAKDKDTAKFLDNAVLVAHNKVDPLSGIRTVVQGSRPSEGDVARVAQMYWNTKYGPDEVANKDKWQQVAGA